MQISVATNWDDDLIDSISFINTQKPIYPVKEIFGSIQIGPIGSGRSAAVLPSISKEKAFDHIKKTQDQGIQFNYLLNASCLGNQEYDHTARDKIFKYLDWISSLDIDIVTVTIPYLIEIIKKNYPHLNINVSIINHVESVKRLKSFNDLGLKRITLSFFKNRSFKFLQKARSMAECELEVLANDPCLLDCPNRYYHYNVVSHGSQMTANNNHGSFFFDYPFLNCTIKKLEDISEIIKSPWIRPEDVEFYDDINIEWLKLSGRFMDTSWLVRCIKSYANGVYKGNLWDIIDKDSFKGLSRKFNTSVASPDLIGQDIEIMEKFSVFVDNQKLNGFIDHFLKNGDECYLNCATCDYCKRVSQNVIQVDKTKLKSILDILNKAKSIMLSNRHYNDVESCLKESWQHSVSM